MRFSIVIPVYNVEKYLMKCIESVEKQSFQDYEVVLVDDGSTDKSGMMCDQFASSDSKIRVIHKQNGGLLSARRVGFQNALGEYVISCDSDDFLEKDALDAINNIIEECKPDLIAFNAYIINGSQKTLFCKPLFYDGIIDKDDFLEKMFSTYALNSMCMKAVKSEILDKERDYSDYYSYNFGEDILQSVPLILKACSIYYTGKALYDYRISSGMMRKYSSSYYWSYKKVNKKIRTQMKENGVKKAEYYADQHILNSTYGAIIQAQFLDKVPLEDWKKISSDSLYKKAVKNKAIRRKINIKEKIVLIFFNSRAYGILFRLLKINNKFVL